MVFSKLFKKGEMPPPAPPEPEEEDAAESDEPAGDPEAGEEHVSWSTRAQRVIPNGASTGSKRIETLYGDATAAADWPTHFVRASGCHIVTTEGDTLLD